MASGSDSEALVMLRNYCTCQTGYTLIYECKIIGEGSTVWSGTAFECPATGNEIILYNHINYTEECNGGMITGRVIKAEESSHTSQLSVDISSALNGRGIVCLHNIGQTTAVIGSYELNITTGTITM